MAKQIIFGLSTTFLTKEEKVFFLQNPVAGFILFKRNIESSTQLRQLIIDLKNLYPQKPPLILVDQEGGRVARLKPPLINRFYPPAAHFGELYTKDGKESALKEVYANYFDLMSALKEFAIDSPCAPVLDLYHDFADKVVGDRSFGGNVNMTVDLAIAAVKAIVDAGGIAIIKHIPGHGRALCDSHKALPRVTASKEELTAADFAAFKEVIRQLSAKYLDKVWAMSAHIIFDCLDRRRPVTMSKKAVSFIRHEIGFKGILITDDICMSALHGKIGTEYREASGLSLSVEAGYVQGLEDAANLQKLRKEYISSLAQATKKSFAAGCDMVLHCSGNLEEMQAVCKVSQSL